MDLESVKKLADLMEERGLTKVEVCEGEHKISLSKEQAAPIPAAQLALAPPPAAQGAAAGAMAPAPRAEGPAAAAGKPLESPLVGVVYLAPKPDSANFVSVGSRVKKGQTLCIVEAMKVMNEFTAPSDGEITEICVSNEELVEYGQVLFRLL